MFCELTDFAQQLPLQCLSKLFSSIVLVSAHSLCAGHLLTVLVRVFTSLALECQLIVISDDDEIRMAACEVLLMLLHPLQWAQVYVPLIPDAWLLLLNNPFPCVLGLKTAQANALPSPCACRILNLR